MNVKALQQLYSLMCSIPDKEVNLNVFYMKYSDGSVCGCGLGYAALAGICDLYLEPEYHLPALTADAQGLPAYKGMDAAAKAFGITRQEAISLFTGFPRNAYAKGEKSFKQIWLERMEKFAKDNCFSLQQEEPPVVADTHIRVPRKYIL